MNKFSTNFQSILEERVARFGEDVIDFAKSVDRNEINRSLISQIVRSATSIGANYMEANQASRKEANETKHWARMIAKANKEKESACRKLWSEAHELTLIFAKISKSCDTKNIKES